MILKVGDILAPAARRSDIYIVVKIEGHDALVRFLSDGFETFISSNENDAIKSGKIVVIYGN